METKTIEGIVKALKEIIDQKGPKYLTDEPYQVYVELISSGVADRKTAAALLHLLASGLLETADPGYDAELLSGSIKEWQTGLPLSCIRFTQKTIKESGEVGI